MLRFTFVEFLMILELLEINILDLYLVLSVFAYFKI
jgi:hypothetical protein